MRKIDHQRALGEKMPTRMCVLANSLGVYGCLREVLMLLNRNSVRRSVQKR